MHWRKLKAIVFESDDWGGLERGIPDLRTQKLLKKNKDIVRALGARPNDSRRYYTIMDTLESTADLDALFQMLLHFRGGDGRPAVFTPVYLLASPDYQAIRANGFTKYVDIGIDRPYPALFRRCGDITAKAREGLRLGVWVPESHNTRMAAHIDPHKWVRLLREKKDPALNAFFNLNMIGRPSEVSPAALGKEFDSMTVQALRAWVAGGTRYFRKAFGYAPRAAGLADARNCCKIMEDIVAKIMVENGVQTIFNGINRAMGAYDRKLGLTYIRRNVNFEPLLAPREHMADAWRAALREIERVWDANQPAIVNTHRLHYVGMNPAQKKEGFRQLECLLDGIRQRHPEAVYMSSNEVGALYRQAAIRKPGKKRPAAEAAAPRLKGR